MDQHCTYTCTITLPDGSTAEHTAEALAYRHESDGAISVTAACCGVYGGDLCGDCNGAGCERCQHKGVFAAKGRESTLSRHTFYDVGMPVSDGVNVVAAIDPVQEVQKHVQAVAERHAARHKAKVSKLDALMKPKPAPIAPDPPSAPTQTPSEAVAAT